MTKTQVQKLSYNEIFKSTTMFYINDCCEKSIKIMLDQQTENVLVGLRTISSKETLKQYIVDHRDSLDSLTSVAEISEEKFKRMVSMIRKDLGFVFTTEWSLHRIRSAMMENSKMMESILNLIWEGKNDPKMQKCIPSFYLENMAIGDNLIAKIQDEVSIRRLVKRSLEGTYSNIIGDAILTDIEKLLKKVCVKHGLQYQKNVRIPKLDRTVSFVLESQDNPKLLLDVSYSVTTSSSQGTKKEIARATKKMINSERVLGNNIIYVNFLDGAGWIGRQADLKEIYCCSDYVLNFQHINLLEEIIDVYINDIRGGFTT